MLAMKNILQQFITILFVCFTFTGCIDTNNSKDISYQNQETEKGIKRQFGINYPIKKSNILSVIGKMQQWSKQYCINIIAVNSMKNMKGEVSTSCISHLIRPIPKTLKCTSISIQIKLSDIINKLLKNDLRTNLRFIWRSFSLDQTTG